MRLVNAHIVNYRSVENSDEFPVEHDVTCLVGKNESGKTATLKALCRLNPVESSAVFDEEIDFPATQTGKRRQWAADELVPVVTATFELDDAEFERVARQYGLDVLRSRQFTVTRGYRSGEIYWDFDFDEQKMLWLLLDKLDPTVKETVGTIGINSVEDLTKALRKLEEPSSASTELLNQLDGGGGEGWTLLHSLIAPALPKFVYFDDYDSMPGKASIPDLIQRRNQGVLTRGEQALVSLLRIAGSELEDFLAQDNHERLIRRQENANASISREVFKYWRQSTDLVVKLEVLSPEVGAKAPLDQGPILQIRVFSNRHGVSVPFDERSRGFVWFFSFLAYFTDLEDSAKQQLVLLLDEPGLSLHGRAQEDLLRLIDERLAPKHQVLYSTHSPFMVSADQLHRLRTVIDYDEIGTKISSEIFKADEDTAFPLYAALGIGMTQSLFIGEHTLLLEGPSDLIYLDVLSDALTDLGRTGLDPRWVKTPIGGSGKLSTFVTLLGANKVDVAVLVDSSTQDVGAVKRLRDNNQLAKSGLVEISEFTQTGDADIEDIFDPAFYLDLVNRAYARELGGTTISLADINAKDPRIVRQVEQYFRNTGVAGGRFSHLKPATTLLREQTALAPALGQATLAKAESLFVRLNGLLRS
ncbi:ATP-dependent nuclease [Amycolatopsis sp. NPDC003861]